MRVHSAVLDPRPRSRMPFVAVLLAALVVVRAGMFDSSAPGAPGAEISEGRVRARLRAEGWEPGDPLPDGMLRTVGATM